MKRFLATALLAIVTAAAGASAQDAPPISPAQLEKMVKYLDTVGSTDSFPPPTAESLGLSGDVGKALPVVIVSTDDHSVYFCRSQLNPADFIVWARVAGDKTSSYMFSTHIDLKLVRALRLRANDFPQPLDVDSSQVQALYKKALAALAKDIDASPPPKH
jgi:hypothetical protein